MLTKDKLYEVMSNPWFLQVMDRHDLERVAKDYPYFNTLNLLIAKKAQLQNHNSFDTYLHKAAIYAGSREALYNLIHNISPVYTSHTPSISYPIPPSVSKPDNMLLIDYSEKVAFAPEPYIVPETTNSASPEETAIDITLTPHDNTQHVSSDVDMPAITDSDIAITDIVTPIETTPAMDSIIQAGAREDVPGIQISSEVATEVLNEDNEEESIDWQNDAETISIMEIENVSQDHFDLEVLDELAYLSKAEMEHDERILAEDNTDDDVEDISGALSMSDTEIEISLLPLKTDSVSSIEFILPADLSATIGVEEDESPSLDEVAPDFTEQALAFAEEHKDELPTDALTDQGTLITDDEGEKPYFDLNEKRTFMQWLTFFKEQKETAAKMAVPIQNIVPEKLFFEELPKAPENTPIIEKYVPKEDAVKIDATALANRSVEEDYSDMVSETLAQLLVNQGQYEKAIVMYARLSLLNPSKTFYFADIIKELKQKTNH